MFVLRLYKGLLEYNYCRILQSIQQHNTFKLVIDLAAMVQDSKDFCWPRNGTFYWGNGFHVSCGDGPEHFCLQFSKASPSAIEKDYINFKLEFLALKTTAPK